MVINSAELVIKLLNELYSVSTDVTLTEPASVRDDREQWDFFFFLFPTQTS